MPEDPIVQDKESVFTPEALEASAQADADLEAWEEQAGFTEDHFDEIAEGEVSTEDFWGERGESHAMLDAGAVGSEADAALEDWDTAEAPDTPLVAPDVPKAPEVPEGPEPGDLDWEPSETGVQYPDPERMEGNVGGPERLG